MGFLVRRNFARFCIKINLEFSIKVIIACVCKVFRSTCNIERIFVANVSVNSRIQSWVMRGSYNSQKSILFTARIMTAFWPRALNWSYKKAVVLNAKMHTTYFIIPNSEAKVTFILQSLIFINWISAEELIFCWGTTEKPARSIIGQSRWDKWGIRVISFSANFTDDFTVNSPSRCALHFKLFKVLTKFT